MPSDHRLTARSSVNPQDLEAPTIDIAVGYSKSNTSPVLELFVSRLDELVRLGGRPA